MVGLLPALRQGNNGDAESRLPRSRSDEEPVPGIGQAIKPHQTGLGEGGGKMPMPHKAELARGPLKGCVGCLGALCILVLGWSLGLAALAWLIGGIP